MNGILTKAGLALALMLATTSWARAAVLNYCPEHADSSCSNRVIERDSTKAYQRNPHGNVRSVLLYDRVYLDMNVYSAGRQALRRALSRLSREYGFRLEITDASESLDSARLREVDVLVFAFGSGNVLGPDTSAASAAVQRHVYERGGGILLVNAAAEYVPCPQDSLGDPGCVFLARAVSRQFRLPLQVRMRLYADSVRSGERPPHLVCEDAQCTRLVPHAEIPPLATWDHGLRNPETRNIFTGLPRTIEGLRERWFAFRSSPRLVDDMPRALPALDDRVYVEGRVNVLFSLDESSRALPSHESMGDHPVIWTRKMGNGLSAFTNLGHEDLYVSPRAASGGPIDDSIAHKITWRLLRYLARDFRGCMNPASIHHNPEASVERLTGTDVADPCTTPAALRPARSGFGKAAEVTARGRSLRVVPLGAGEHRVRISDAAGRQIFSGVTKETLEIPGLEPGLYFVRVRAPGGAVSLALARVLGP